MADKFVTAHAGAKKAEARVNDIFAVRQMHGEGLRDFLARFNRVRMSFPNVLGEWRLMKFPPTTWEEIHNAYCTEVRADEEDLNSPIQRLTSVQAEVRKDHRNDGRRDQLGPILAEKGISSTSGHPSHLLRDIQMPLLDIQCHTDTRKERGHRTEDCIGLWQKVEIMLNQGHLKELLSDRGRANFARGREQPQGPPKPTSPARTIQMIIGRGDDTTINHVNFTTTHKLKRSITHERYDDLEDSTIFDKSDTNSLSFPHYDALVITLRIADTNVKRIMVDDGSITCIIHPRVLIQMRLKDKIISRCIILTGFNNAVERTFGEIVLLILAGGVTLETMFHVMDEDTAYNAII
uniref:Retrotransposon gag domain-containing protein n=1 Tax=Nicotiana tabacum TaxID=4097 RepID=A0A1S4BRV9_TOBAC|nr:PREDICTED: uncharacterized protein LOC107811248 [Nicotiana tabacum]